MELRSLAIAVLAALAFCGQANAAYVVDTGTPTGGPNWSLYKYQYFAGEFSVSGGLTINSVEGYFDAYNGGNMTFNLHADGGNIPGGVLFSTTSYFGPVSLGWHGVFGLNWNVVAGTYWVSFVPDNSLAGAMPGTAPNPVGEYAQGNYLYGWSDCGANCRDYLDIGIRIDADTAVPEPMSLALVGLGLAGLGVGRRKRAT